MSYVNILEDKVNYKNFNLGEEEQVISVESLLLDDDFKTNDNYYIYDCESIEEYDYRLWPSNFRNCCDYQNSPTY